MSIELDPDRSLWHLIALELQERRERSEISANKISKELGIDRSTVSRWENGHRKLNADYAPRIDDLLNTNRLFTRLVHFAELMDDLDESDWLSSLAEYEARATRIRLWETLLMPGLFQTPDYARAVIQAGLADDPELILTRRIDRQKAVFDKPNPPYISAVLNWIALMQPVGSPEVMRGQLEWLLELADRPNISIRVVEQETRNHCGLDGPFKLLTVDDRDIAYQDAAQKGHLMLAPADVQKIAVRYERISELAIPVGPSRALITRELERYQ